jgi:hypothetical protein
MLACSPAIKADIRAECIFLPAHRAERPLQHPPDEHRLGAEIKIHGAPMQGALGLGRAIALAEIVEPSRLAAILSRIRSDYDDSALNNLAII